MSVLDEREIQDRLTQAMRARATGEVMVLRGLVAAIKNLRIERRGAAGGGAGELVEADITQLVRREIKQREEAMTFAERAGRIDLIDKNRSEKGFLETFLPQALSTAELEQAIVKHHQGGATSMGPLMAKLKGEFGGRLDGKVASDAVRDFLLRKEGS
jgi:uncharacterized protein